MAVTESLAMSLVSDEVSLNECKAMCGTVAQSPVYSRLTFHHARVSMLQVNVVNAFAAAGGYVNLIRTLRRACGVISDD